MAMPMVHSHHSRPAHRGRRCGVRVQAWPTTSAPTASGAGDVAFGSRRGQQHPRPPHRPPHPELAMWRSGPGVANNIRAHRIRSWRCGVRVQACLAASGVGRQDQDNKEAEEEVKAEEEEKKKQEKKEKKEKKEKELHLC